MELRQRLDAILRPRPGRRLPPELRAWRASRTAGDLASGVRGAEFEELIQRIDQSLIHGGNEVGLFHRGEDAFASMKESILAARREVLLESYIFKDDDTGSEFLSLLGKAAGRGVQVSVLADAFGSLWTGARFWRDMAGKGVEVRLFHRLFPHLWYQPFRDHRKILVVDRRVAFTGGMNIANEYGSPWLREQRASWRDSHARISGPVAEEMAAVFSEAWLRAGGRELPVDGVLGDEVESRGSARALVLDSRPGRGHGESAAVLAAMVGAARESVYITNAYFAPGKTAIHILAEAARRGVDVRLLLPGETDVPLVRHAGHAWFEVLLRAGVRIHEYQSAILHAKTMVVDRFASMVGSSNLDFRSFRFNAECNVVILDEATGLSLAKTFLQDLGHSREIEAGEWSGRNLRHRCLDALAGALAPFL